VQKLISCKHKGTTGLLLHRHLPCPTNTSRRSSAIFNDSNMARRYGSSYSSSSRCFNDYWSTRPSAMSQYARGVVFLVVFLGIFITSFVMRKRAGAGKRLIGWAYTGALFFTVL
jgi:hypothetical protein